MTNGPSAARRGILVLLLQAASTLWSSQDVGAVNDRVEVGGYVKGFAAVLNPADAGDKIEGATLLRARLALDWHHGRSLSFHGAYELSPRIRTRGGLASVDALSNPLPVSYRIADLRARLYPSSDRPEGRFSLVHVLDRAVATFSWPSADLSVGRQAIAFGSARAINPTDVIAPFAYEELDKEERVGVDAVRLRIPAGAMGEVDCGAVFGPDADPGESAAYLRVKGYARETDMAGLVMVYRENLLLGVDLARSIRGAGSWLEIAYSLPKVARDHTDGKGYLRVSCGLDTFFERGIYAFCEYHFSGAGSGEPSAYLDSTNQTAYREGAVYLLGRHYLVPGLSFDINPLLKLGLESLINLTDRSALLSSRLTYSMAEDVSAEAGGFWSWGRGPSIAADPNTGTVRRNPRSEFGLYPSQLFASIRFYF